MPSIGLTVTDRQETAWRLRHTKGWPVERIARHLRISSCAVSHLLRRARQHKGDPRRACVKRRVIRPVSLSLFHLQ